ncbi:MAG: iron-containing alcohol dehydrogenase family protein [Acidobacteriota bacterium]|nr:iron-containing alcohol dehydrogenase family protein [Acidobacteriota bacterium]
MSKEASQTRMTFVRTGPSQYVNRAGVLRQAGESIAPWGNRALISGGEKALASAQAPLTKSLDKTGIAWRKHLFTGESSRPNIAAIKADAQKHKANVIVGVGGGKSIDAAKQAAADLDLPVVCIPTIAATCAATTALSIIYTDRGVFQKIQFQPTNPSLVLVDPNIITKTPTMYLRAGILDSLAKWYEGRSVVPNVQNPDAPTVAAFQLAEVLYKGHKKYAIEAVRLNNEHRVDDALVHTLDLTILLTGMIQSLSKGTLFTSIAHPLHNGMTLIKESHNVLHGLKVGYAIVVQLIVEKSPKKELESVISFFGQLGLVPSLKALNLPFDRDLVLRVADMTARSPHFGPLNYTVDKFEIAAAMEILEKRFA